MRKAQKESGIAGRDSFEFLQGESTQMFKHLNIQMFRCLGRHRTAGGIERRTFQRVRSFPDPTALLRI